MNPQINEIASVLVVDDNPLIVNVLRSLLQSENYQVFSSDNGEQALDILKTKEVDVIICDVMMPRMDGYELHKQIRSKSEFSHIPFVFLTSLGDEQEIAQGKETGADDYMVKPFDPRHLLALVKGKVTRARGLKNFSEQRYDSYRKKVIHTLSHEFRTPLVAINTGTELLLEQHDKLGITRVQNLLEAIKRGGQRLEKLVSDFMLLQQIEAGIATRMFDTRAAVKLVSEVITSGIDIQRETLEAQGFTIALADQAAGALVRVYEPQIFDILGRLFSNAVKFKSKEHHVEVQIYPQDGDVHVDVMDRGIGMDITRVKEAIDVFGQIDRDRLEQQGGGLGLAIANRYAHINSGRLDFAQRPGGGSIVTLVLPIVPKS